jgi:hypothetical protein
MAGGAADWLGRWVVSATNSSPPILFFERTQLYPAVPEFSIHSFYSRSMEEKLERITFLRLFPQQSFQFVDRVIDEITQSNAVTSPPLPSQKRHSEVQTDVLFKENEGNEEETTEKLQDLPIYTTQHNSSSLVIRFASSFQYNSQAEFASLAGRIGTRFIDNEKELASHDTFRLTSTVIDDQKPLDESLETQQMRRLEEFVEWRKSILQNNYP